MQPAIETFYLARSQPQLLAASRLSLSLLLEPKERSKAMMRNDRLVDVAVVARRASRNSDRWMRAKKNQSRGVFNCDVTQKISDETKQLDDNKQRQQPTMDDVRATNRPGP